MVILMPMRHHIVVVAMLVLAAGATSRAVDDVGIAVTGSDASAFDSSQAWLLIIAGHPGDRQHEEQFADVANRLSGAARDRLGFDERRVWIWSGIDAEAPDAVPGSRGPATRAALQRDVAELRSLAHKDSELWVIVLGHAHARGDVVQLNLPGTDVDAEEFASWFAGFPCRRSVFFVTTPHGSAFLKPLAEPGRVVIAAAADGEGNGTLFPLALAEQMESLSLASASDSGEAASVTLLDLYLAVASDVSARYEAEELIPTEHAQLDDNGDGRGSEVQNRKNASEAPPPRGGDANYRPDGALAASIRFEFLPAPSQPR